MRCVQTEYQDRRVVHALTPSPITRGIAKADSRPFGLNRWVFRVPLAVGLILVLKDALGGVL